MSPINNAHLNKYIIDLRNWMTTKVLLLITQIQIYCKKYLINYPSFPKYI